MRHRALIVALMLFAGACGDSGGSVFDTTTTSTSSTSTTTTSTSSTSTTTTSTTTPGRTLDFTAPSPTSYLYSVTLSGETETGSETITFQTDVEGAFSSPDSHFVTRRDFLNGELQEEATAIVIGDQAWVDDGTGFTEFSRNAAAVQAIADDFTSMSDVIPDADFYDRLRNTPVEVVEEDFQDQPTLHVLVADPDVLVALLENDSELPVTDLDSVSFDLWLKPDTGEVLGYLITLEGPSELFSADLAGITRVEVNAVISDYDDPSIEITPPAADGSQPPPGYCTFEDPEVGFFSLFYPCNWTVPDDVPTPVEEGVSIAFEALSPPESDDDTVTENFNVTVEFVDFPGLTLDQYTDLNLDTLETLAGFELLVVTEFTTETGFDARWVEFTAADEGGGTLYFIQVYLFEFGTGYVVTYTALPETIGLYLGEFFTVVDSFQLL